MNLLRELVDNIRISEGIHMKFYRERFRKISEMEVKEWGRIHYGEWLVDMQSQKNIPKSPVEFFFRYYSQGIDFAFNRALRSECDIEKYCKESFIKPEMFYDAICEMEKHPIPEDIVVFRYVEMKLWYSMLKWSGIKKISKNPTIFDKGFMSTTLTPELVHSQERHLGKFIKLKIYVPEKTPCAFLELISDMNENEVLFPPNTKLRVLSRPGLFNWTECVVEL